MVPDVALVMAPSTPYAHPFPVPRPFAVEVEYVYVWPPPVQLMREYEGTVSSMNCLAFLQICPFSPTSPKPSSSSMILESGLFA